jgi:hypothetical protein
LPKEINAALKTAADNDYMTKNQKAIEIFKAWMDSSLREQQGKVGE